MKAQLFRDFCCPQNNTPKRACAAWMHPGVAPPGGVYEGAQLQPVAIRMALGGPRQKPKSVPKVSTGHFLPVEPPKIEKIGQNSPHWQVGFKPTPEKCPLGHFFWTQFGLQSVVYLSRVRARVSWTSLNSELGWHINLCIFDVHVLHTSGGPGAGASGHCQRSASVGALRSPFILSFVVFPTLHPPREPSGGLVL
jgi:hypothetical protein